MTLFKALYDYAPPLHIPYFPYDSNLEDVGTFLRAKEATIQLLQDHLQKTQNRMKMLVDKKGIERVFPIGVWVYVEL